MICMIMCVPTVSLMTNVQNGFTATLNSGGALHQVNITSKILNRLLPMWGQNAQINSASNYIMMQCSVTKLGYFKV